MAELLVVEWKVGGSDGYPVNKKPLNILCCISAEYQFYCRGKEGQFII